MFSKLLVVIVSVYGEWREIRSETVTCTEVSSSAEGSQPGKLVIGNKL